MSQPLDQTLYRQRASLSDIGVDVEEVGPRLRRKDQPLHGLVIRRLSREAKSKGRRPSCGYGNAVACADCDDYYAPRVERR